MAEDLGFPGNREMVEQQLGKSTTQVLYLAAEERAGHRSLAERAADLVRGVELVPAEERFWTMSPSPAAVAVAEKAGIPADIADAYLKAETDVKAALAEVYPA